MKELASIDYITFTQLMNRNPPRILTYNRFHFSAISIIESIQESTLLLMKRFSPMRQASKVILTNACSGMECSFFSERMAEIFNSFPHFYLRVLDLSGNSLF